MTDPALFVIAKAPVAGRCKTRLCPPCTPEQAAALAEAALVDTLAAVLATPAARHVLVLDGEPGPWMPAGLDVVPQRGDGLAERLGAAFEDAGAPALLVGMDTPQVTPARLSDGLDLLRQGGDAVLGMAPDGGYWAIGLRRADRSVFTGVPMSEADTGERQCERLEVLGLRPQMLPELRDFDEIADARHIAAEVPHGRFAAALAAIELDDGARVA
ncbi:MAG: TIGR04282 family arsenosugar biosynthesis glycosyltransferase [Solirubrobacteraceae bacterium]